MLNKNNSFLNYVTHFSGKPRTDFVILHTGRAFFFLIFFINYIKCVYKIFVMNELLKKKKIEKKI